MTIHPTAVVSEGAQIENGVTIGPYAVIGSKVKIGKGTTIGSHTVIDGDTTIGENNNIYPFASIGQNPQDLKYKGEDTKLIIGNNNTIREFVTINKGTIAAERTEIGNNNLLMAYVHIAHDCILGSNCILANAATLAGHVILEDFAFVGGLSGVHQFVKIGAHAMVGGATKITQDIIPFVTVDGNDARVQGLNLTGLKRRGFTNDDIRKLKEAYNIIFRDSKTLKEGTDELKQKFADDKNIMYMAEFIEKCERGICRPKRGKNREE